MGGIVSKPKAAAPAPAPVVLEPEPVQSTDDARRRAAVSRSRRAGRPLLGPGGARQDNELQTTLGVG